MNLKYFWKVWLRPNLLKQGGENKYYAEISAAGTTLRNEDIARQIREQGSEIKYETILSILNQGDNLRLQNLLSGNAVQDGIAHYTPRVTGNWIGPTARFDRTIHRLTFDVKPIDKVRRALRLDVDVEILGTKESGAYIGLVTDVASGLSDGILVIGGDAIVSGKKIKVVPAGEEGLGVFLVPVGKTEPVIPVAGRYARNTPSTLIIRLPSAIPEGAYYLQVVTHYTGSNDLLREPRTITYGEVVTLVTHRT